ncbi:MAG: hypothetical protein LBJ09_00625 [Clostridiales bacterium]|nr:hypothetical protein [Clostridiales bacterium]
MLKKLFLLKAIRESGSAGAVPAAASAAASAAGGVAAPATKALTDTQITTITSFVALPGSELLLKRWNDLAKTDPAAANAQLLKDATQYSLKLGDAEDASPYYVVDDLIIAQDGTVAGAIVGNEFKSSDKSSALVVKLPTVDEAILLGDDAKQHLSKLGAPITDGSLYKAVDAFVKIPVDELKLIQVEIEKAKGKTGAGFSNELSKLKLEALVKAPAVIPPGKGPGDSDLSAQPPGKGPGDSDLSAQPQTLEQVNAEIARIDSEIDAFHKRIVSEGTFNVAALIQNQKDFFEVVDKPYDSSVALLALVVASSALEMKDKKVDGKDQKLISVADARKLRAILSDAKSDPKKLEAYGKLLKEGKVKEAAALITGDTHDNAIVRFIIAIGSAIAGVLGLCAERRNWEIIKKEIVEASKVKEVTFKVEPSDKVYSIFTPKPEDVKELQVKTREKEELSKIAQKLGSGKASGADAAKAPTVKPADAAKTTAKPAGGADATKTTAKPAANGK